MRRSQNVWLLSVLMLASAALCLAQSPSLENVKTVYLWPMRHSLDQYLAEQLSAENLFQVVVDPKLADAIITERIDAPFLSAMDSVFPAESGPAGKAEDTPASSAASAGSVEEGLQAARPVNRAMARPEGTVFLVHAASRKVLWSTFIIQKDYAPKNLHQQARDVVGRLKKATTPNP